MRPTLEWCRALAQRINPGRGLLKFFSTHDQVAAIKLSAAELQPLHLGSFGDGLDRDGIGQISEAQIGSAKVRIAQAAALQLSSFKVGAAQVSAFEIGSTEISADQISAAQISADEIKAAQITAP